MILGKANTAEKVIIISAADPNLSLELDFSMRDTPFLFFFLLAFAHLPDDVIVSPRFFFFYIKMMLCFILMFPLFLFSFYSFPTFPLFIHYFYLLLYFLFTQMMIYVSYLYIC